MPTLTFWKSQLTLNYCLVMWSPLKAGIRVAVLPVAVVALGIPPGSGDDALNASVNNVQGFKLALAWIVKSLKPLIPINKILKSSTFSHALFARGGGFF